MPVFGAEESTFEMIPEGTIVAAKVLSIVPVTLQFGPKLNWKFEVTEPGDWQGYKINGSTTQNFTLHEKCKLMQWASALLGRVFEVGDQLDTDDLIGLPCRILIEWQPDKNDDEKFWMRAGDVMGVRAHGAEAVFG